MLKNRRGFTLIELLVVVLIIAILAALALPQYQFTVLRSRAVQAMVLIDEIWEAQQVYFLANGEYTTTFNKLDLEIPGAEDSHYLPQSWGYCDLYTTTSGYCQVNIKNGGYIAFFRLFSDSTRFCRANEHTLQEKVCISLGGKFDSRSSQNGWIQYKLN